MQTKRVLTIWQLICFGLLTTPLAMAGFALVIYVPTYYAVDMGLGLGAVGAVFLFGRLFDVVTDPLIGFLSDHTQSRFGPRLPWMVLGFPGLALSIWFLLSPPDGVGIFYLLSVSGAFFLFYTIVDVPYSSIGLEISPDTHERTYLAGSKAVFQVIGAILASLVPIYFASKMGMSLMAIAAIALGLLGLGLGAILAFVPLNHGIVLHPRPSLSKGWRAALDNPSFRWLVGVFFIVQTANALCAGLLVLFTGHIIQAPQMIGLFFLAMFGATAIFLPIWIVISRRWSKPSAWMVSILMCCVALFYATTLGPGNVAGMLVVSALLGAAFGCDAVMPTSMLADIVNTGQDAGTTRKAATLLAFKNAVSKMTFVVPMGLAFPTLGLVGFDKTGVNSADALGVLVGFFAGLPIVLRLIGAALLAVSQRSGRLSKAALQA